jgi:hypothetical protein
MDKNIGPCKYYKKIDTPINISEEIYAPVEIIKK